jgi:hypothetical protein
MTSLAHRVMICNTVGVKGTLPECNRLPEEEIRSRILRCTSTNRGSASDEVSGRVVIRNNTAPDLKPIANVIGPRSLSEFGIDGSDHRSSQPQIPRFEYLLETI